MTSFVPPQSNLVKSLPSSGIRAFFDLVLSMDDVISLGVGEPDFPTPWHISKYAIDKIEDGFTTYASNSGLLQLREEISKYHQHFYQTNYDPESEVLITVGVSEGLDLALRAILNPGDSVMYHEPCYVSYRPGIELAGGKALAIPTFEKDGFKVVVSELEKVIKPTTKAMILNYPCNPTGATYTISELELITQFAKKHNIYILSDEIYHQLSFDSDHVSLASLPDMKDRVLTLNGFSKGFAMTGWRVGYAAGAASVVSLMTKIHQYTMLCVPIMSQFAAIEALVNGHQAVLSMKKEYNLRRDVISERLNDMGFKCHRPGGAFYLFPELPVSFDDATIFAQELLEEEKVAVVPGIAFGPCPHNIRISYASSMSNLEKAMDRIERFIRKRVS